MMGPAMLKRHRFVQSLWGWPKCVCGESGAALVDILLKIHSARGFPMMGAAMLKRHRFVQSLRGWPKCVGGGVRRSPCSIVIKLRHIKMYPCI